MAGTGQLWRIAARRETRASRKQLGQPHKGLPKLAGKKWIAING
jgi:hypothetical protein